MRVFLFQQTLKDGRVQFRRFSPDKPSEFLGFEKQNSAAQAWMNLYGNPVWPDDAFNIVKTASPYLTI